jgi:toxin-antitoxin system PIN domain toxin
LIAIDTNILVYSHRSDSPLHGPARELIEQLRRGRALWAIPWPCVHEFLAVTTHPRIFKDPTPLATAFEAIEAWHEGENLQLLSESEGYLETLREQSKAAQTRGPLVHDARIAALCLHHGVSELWSADRDFSRFPRLSVRNPLS